MLDENIDRHRMLIILFIDCQRLLIQIMVGGDLGNLASIIIIQLVDVAHNLALLDSNGR